MAEKLLTNIFIIDLVKKINTSPKSLRELNRLEAQKFNWT